MRRHLGGNPSFKALALGICKGSLLWDPAKPGFSTEKKAVNNSAYACVVFIISFMFSVKNVLIYEDTFLSPRHLETDISSTANAVAAAVHITSKATC